MQLRNVLAALLFVLYLAALCSLLILKWLPIPGVFPPVPLLPQLDINSFHVNLTPFHSLALFWNARGVSISDEDVWKNLWGNILVLLPFAPLFPSRRGRIRPLLIICSGLSLILSIELIQLLSGIGVWDIDDIFLNTIGLLGGFLFLLPRLIRRKKGKKRG